MMIRLGSADQNPFLKFTVKYSRPLGDAYWQPLPHEEKWKIKAKECKTLDSSCSGDILHLTLLSELVTDSFR